MKAATNRRPNKGSSEAVRAASSWGLARSAAVLAALAVLVVALPQRGAMLFEWESG